MHTPTPVAGAIAAAIVVGLTKAREDPMGACVLLENGRHFEAAKVLKSITTPVDAGDFESGIAALTYDLAQLEREASILGRATGWRQVPLRTKVLLETSVGRAAWVSEALAAPALRANYSEALDALAELKLISLAVVSAELVQNAGRNAVPAVRQAMADQLGEDVDRELLDPDRAPVTDERPGSITYGAPSFIASGAAVADIDHDLTMAADSVASSGARLAGAFWVASEQTALRLSLKRGSSGAPAFPDVNVSGPSRLAGLPMFTSRACEGTGSPTSRFLSLIAPREVAVANGTAAQMDTSRHAALQLDDAPGTGAQPMVSLWQAGLIGFRIQRSINWQRLRTAAVATITDLPY